MCILLQAEYKGWNGNVYCCNSDNCNTENLSHTQEHRHTCINAVKDQTTSLGTYIAPDKEIFSSKKC